MAEYKLLINGELVNSSTGKVVDDIGPASGEAVAQVPQSSVEDVEQAVAAAREAFDDGRWSRLPHGARAAALEKLAQVIEAHSQELAELACPWRGTSWARKRPTSRALAPPLTRRRNVPRSKEAAVTRKNLTGFVLQLFQLRTIQANFPLTAQGHDCQHGPGH